MRDGRSPTAPRDRASPPEERSLTGLTSFRGSFPRADVELFPPRPEIAFLGRSNVGKSSLLNALLGERVARISATPGKTRALNVFEARIPSRDRRTPRRAAYLLDLPGYGYARAGKADRLQYHALVTETLKRPALSGVVWLLDVRRDPSTDDVAILELLGHSGAGVLTALTKGDTLSRAARGAREQALQESLGMGPDQVLVTSARTGEGIAALRLAVAGFLAGLSAG